MLKNLTQVINKNMSGRFQHKYTIFLLCTCLDLHIDALELVNWR